MHDFVFVDDPHNDRISDDGSGHQKDERDGDEHLGGSERCNEVYYGVIESECELQVSVGLGSKLLVFQTR